MFYSKDLLSRKNPLGAIWTIAHGKKISKSKLLGISVQEICNQILHPEVPHSLRLQGILVGGVVVLYNKQQVYLLEDVQDMVRQVKEAIHIDNFGGKATLKRGNDKAKHGAITLNEMEVAMDNPRLTDINNMAANMGTADHVPLTQRLGSFRDVVLEEEDPELFIMPALSSRDTGRLSTQGSEQEEVAGHLHPLPGKGRNAKKFERQPSKDRLHASGAGGVGAGLGDMDVFEQDELFNMDGMLADNDLLAADMGAVPQDMLDRNNAAAMDINGEAIDGRNGEGPLSPKSAERRASLVEEMRAEFARGDQEQLAEWDGGEDRQAVGRKRGRGSVAKEGQQRQQPSKKRGFAALALRALSTDTLEEVQIRSKEFREWTQDSIPLLRPRGFKRKGPLLPSPKFGAVINGPALCKRAAAATEGFGSALKAAFALEALVTWAPDADLAAQATDDGFPDLVAGHSWAGTYGLPLAQCHEMQEVVACALYGQERDQEELLVAALAPANKRQRLEDKGAADKGVAGAATHSVEQDMHDEGGGLRGQEALDHNDTMLAHEEAELQDQLHELPFDNVEVERLRAGGTLTPGAAAALADPAALDYAQRQQLLQQSGRVPGSAHTSASDNSSLHLGIRPGARHGGSFAGSDQDLLLPGSHGATPGGIMVDAMHDPQQRGGSARAGRRAGRPQGALLHWGEGTLADLLPSMGEEGSGLEHLGLRADSEDMSEHSRARRNLPHSNSGSGFASEPLGTAYFQLVESSGHATQELSLQDCVSKNTATVAQILRQRLALQENAGSTDPAVSFLELAQQLTRSEAVKLFMQVLVTHSMNFVSAFQEEAYGDILIRAGQLT